MTAASTLSIVIPTRNSAAYLPALLQSLKALTRQPDEYIIVDGESTDSTKTLLADFSPGVPVHVASVPPKGVYDAWNQGVKLASGEWVWIVCSDDLAHSRSVEEARVAMAEAKPTVGFIGWNINVINAYGQDVPSLAKPGILRSLDPNLNDHAHVRSAALEAALIYLFRGYFLSFMAHAFRRRVWLEAPFSTTLGPPADIDWTFCAHLRGWRKQHIPLTLAAWRVRAGSVTDGFSPVSRIKAHALLRETHFASFAQCLALTADEAPRWKSVQPAHEVYDWFAALRQSKAPSAIGRTLLGILGCAGLSGSLGLAMKKAGLWRNYTYSRAMRQFRQLYTEPRLTASLELLN